jgi:hypothetical protein
MQGLSNFKIAAFNSRLMKGIQRLGLGKYLELAPTVERPCIPPWPCSAAGIRVAASASTDLEVELALWGPASPPASTAQTRHFISKV